MRRFLSKFLFFVLLKLFFLFCLVCFRCMPKRVTRKTSKDNQLLLLSNQELAQLERAGRKAKKPAEMVNTVILRLDEAGILRDQQGHVCNEQGQRLDGEGNPIAPIVEAAMPAAQRNERPVVPDRARMLEDYNRPDEFYANRSAIRLPTFDRNDFELKPSYYALVGNHPFHGLPHEHPMDHIERFEDDLLPTGKTPRERFCATSMMMRAQRT